MVLTLPEVDPSFHKGARVSWPIKPPDDHGGPFRLVIDGDLPSRSVHSVVAIELKHLP